jgi:hypothetical protein
MTKKVIMLGVVVLSVLSLCAYGFAATSGQGAIELDSTGIEAAAYIDGGNLYLPLRAIGEALGYNVGWSGNERTITVSGAGKNIIIDLNNNKINADGHNYYLDTDYKVIEDRTYLGADFFSDSFGLRILWDRQNGPIQLASVQQNAISIKTMKEASETGLIKITLQYPRVDGLEDRTVQDRINSVFNEAAGEARNEGLKNAEEMENYIVSGYTGSPNKCETYFDYRLKYNQKGLLSVVCLDYQYTGGAHGLTVQSSHTFNLKTGEEYQLEDLFETDADYVSIISKAVKDEIGMRIKEGSLPDYSIAPFEAIREDQDFYLSNDAVVVYFQQYEHWPYAAGIQEFPVEFSKLQDMLKPEILQMLQTT